MGRFPEPRIYRGPDGGEVPWTWDGVYATLSALLYIAIIGMVVALAFLLVLVTLRFLLRSMWLAGGARPGSGWCP